MRKKRSIGEQSFPTIRAFVFDVIKMLDEGEVWVTEDRFPLPGNLGPIAVAYHFTVAHQPLGARRRVRYEISVDVESAVVTVDKEFLRLGMINPPLAERLEKACADRCRAQDEEPPNERRAREEGRRTLRRLTREFDRNMKPFHRLTKRLGRS